MARLVKADKSATYNSDEFIRLVGPGHAIVHDDTAAVVIGGSSNVVMGIRAVARQGGVPVSVALHIVTNRADTQHFGGTGGTLRITLRDNTAAGTPDLAAEPFAEAVWRANIPDTYTLSREVREFYLGNVKKRIRRGDIYWICVENTDAAAGTNFCSVSVNNCHKEVSDGNRFLYKFDQNVYMKPGTDSWRNATVSGSGDLYLIPKYRLTYSDGRSEGLFAMGTNTKTNPIRLFRVAGARAIREKIKMYGVKTFSGISFACSCETSGDLNWSIKVGNSVLAEGTVTETAPNYRELSGGIPFVKWYDVDLPKDVKIDHGATAYVEFSASSGSWYFPCTQNDLSFGGAYPASGLMSNCEIKPNTFYKGYDISSEDKLGFDTNMHLLLHLSDGTPPAQSPGTPAQTVESLPDGSDLVVVASTGLGASFFFVTVRGGKIELATDPNPSREGGTFKAIYVPNAGAPVAGTDISAAELGEVTFTNQPWQVNTVDGRRSVLPNSQIQYSGLRATPGVTVGSTLTTRPGSLREASPDITPVFAVTGLPTPDNHVEGAFVWASAGSILTKRYASSLPSPVPATGSMNNMVMFGTGTRYVPRNDAAWWKVGIGSNGEYSIPPDTQPYTPVMVRVPMDTRNTITSVLNKAVSATGATVEGTFNQDTAINLGTPPAPADPTTVADLPDNSTIAVVTSHSWGVAWYWASVTNGRIVLNPGGKPERAVGTFRAIYVPNSVRPVAGSDVSRAKLGSLVLTAGAWPVNTADGSRTVLHRGQAHAHDMEHTLLPNGERVSVGGYVQQDSNTVGFSVRDVHRAFVVLAPPRNNKVWGVFVWVRDGDVLTQEEASSLSTPVPNSTDGMNNFLTFGTGTRFVPRWDARNFRTVRAPQGLPTLPANTRGYVPVSISINAQYGTAINGILNKVSVGGVVSDGNHDRANGIEFSDEPGTSQPPGGGNQVPGAPGIITSSSALLERLMQGMANGHDIRYAGWTDHSGARALGLSPNGGAQTRGGAITMGGCLVPNQIYGSEYYNSNFDGGFSAAQMNQIRYRIADQLALWGCIMDDTSGSTSTRVQLRYGAIYMLFEGSNVWRKILEQGAGTNMPASVTWTYDQGPDMAPGNAAHTAYSRQHNTRLDHQRNIGGGVYEILTPSGKYLNNHFGNGDHAYIHNHPDKDFNRVRGILGFWHIRLAPEHRGRVAAIQVGYDPKWSGIRPANWWPGGMLSRLQRIPDDWGTLGFISVNTAHDANRHSRSLSPAVIRGTTVEGFSA